MRSTGRRIPSPATLVSKMGYLLCKEINFHKSICMSHGSPLCLQAWIVKIDIYGNL